MVKSGLCLGTLALMVVIMAVYQPQSAEAGIGSCWETWSRCTRWSKWLSGTMWQTCSQRCRCLGYASGSCQMVPSSCFLTSKAWQCKCSGRRRGRKPSWCGF